MPANSDAVPTQKQRFNIYTMMLVLSFIATTTACVLLWTELNDYMYEPGSANKIWPPWDATAAKFTPPAN